MKKRLIAIAASMILCLGAVFPVSAAGALSKGSPHHIRIPASEQKATTAPARPEPPQEEPEPPVVYQPVELILQDPELPNGCEVTSLAMALTSAGCPADKMALYWHYLPKEGFQTRGGLRYGPDPSASYAGDATSRSGGWYCFEAPIIQAADSWLYDGGSDLRASAVSGLSQEELDEYAQAGVPLVVWVTLDFGKPRYSTYTWRLPDGTVYTPYRNLHCVLLAGMDEDGRYRIADPINGWRTLDREKFWSCFDAMERRAVVIGRPSSD